MTTKMVVVEAPKQDSLFAALGRLVGEEVDGDVAERRFEDDGHAGGMFIKAVSQITMDPSLVVGKDENDEHRGFEGCVFEIGVDWD